MYVLCFDAQPHHSGGGSLSVPGIPWCPLVAPTVNAPRASDSDATLLKLFLGPVGACYSRSPKNPALQLLQKSSKSASTTPQRPIWNTFGTVAVRDFSENGCKCKKPSGERAAGLEMGPLWLQRQPNAILRYLPTVQAKARGWADRLPQLGYYDSMRVPPCIDPGSNPKTCLFYGGELAPSGPA